GRDIGCDHLRIALDWLAKATPTAAPQPYDLAQFGAVDRALADIVRLAVAPRPDIAACRAGQTAARAPGTEALPVLAAHDDDGARMLDLEFVSDAEPAAVFARPLAVRRQTKAAHDDRRLGFQHLDRHIAQKRDAHLGPRDAVALAARAGAARDRVRDDDPPGAAQFRGRDIGDHEDARSRDRHLARDRLCQGAQHEIVHPHRRREAHAARRREAGIDD